MYSSPMRFLSSIIAKETAESRAYQNPTRDVWELAVWDPLPLCLRIFCFLSPGHVLVYWLFIPTSPHDLYPSTTMLTTISLSCLLSVQLSLMHNSFSQQSKDASLIHKEVMNEYDTKYVHPITHPLMRDVGIQCRGFDGANGATNSVDVYSPDFVVNRGFHTKPNARYINHLDPDSARQKKFYQKYSSRAPVEPTLQSSSYDGDLSSPIQQNSSWRQPAFGKVPAVGSGDGGSLGVYSHAQSPLRKSSAARQRERERNSSPVKLDGSPTKSASALAGIEDLLSKHRLPRSQAMPVRKDGGRF